MSRLISVTTFSNTHYVHLTARNGSHAGRYQGSLEIVRVLICQYFIVHLYFIFVNRSTDSLWQKSTWWKGETCYVLLSSILPTIMDKSLGTNLHLRCFFTRAKQTVRREFIYTCSAPLSPPPPPPPSTMLDKCTRSISPDNIVWGAGVGGEETHNSPF